MTHLQNGHLFCHLHRIRLHTAHLENCLSRVLYLGKSTVNFSNEGVKFISLHHDLSVSEVSGPYVRQVLTSQDKVTIRD